MFPRDERLREKKLLFRHEGVFLEFREPSSFVSRGWTVFLCDLGDGFSISLALPSGCLVEVAEPRAETRDLASFAAGVRGLGGCDADEDKKPSYSRNNS